MERRSFFTSLVSEVVPGGAGHTRRRGARAREQLGGFDRLHLSAAQALAVQAMYEQHATRDALARSELRTLVAQQRRLFQELNEPQLHASIPVPTVK